MADQCYHCREPLPAVGRFPVTVNGETRLMCCPGCQAVAEAIVAGGLANFYQYREQQAARPDAVATDYAAYDLPELRQQFVQSEGAAERADLLIEGITCAACVWLIEKHLSAIDGVQRVSVNASTHRARILFTGVPVSVLMAAIAHIGYRPMSASDENQRALWARERTTLLMRLAVAGFAMMQAMMMAGALYLGDYQDLESRWQSFFRWTSLVVALPVVFFSARPFFTAAWNSLKQRQLIMDVPVAIAIGGAFSASVYATVMNTGEVYFESVAMFTFFLLLGRFLEQRLRHQNANSLSLAALRLPLTARRLTDAGEEVIPLARLQVGDRVRVAAGETLPCDGRILDGSSAVNEALLTGESAPRACAPGDEVIAGSINTDSPLLLSVSAVGQNTRLSAIEQLVNRAETDKPSQVSLADRLARAFVARLLMIAALVGGFWWWYDAAQAFWITLSVLVVTCPCALSLATPVALTRANLWLRQQGLLVTRGHVVEALATVDTVVFDKTGTLTLGEPRLAAIRLLDPAWTDERVTRLCAALEAGSSHPLARAFTGIVPASGVTAVAQQIALGVAGHWQGQAYRFGRPAFFESWFVPPSPPDEGQWLLLASEQGPVAWLAFDDKLRPDAAAAVAKLNALGKTVVLLSGDRPARAQALASQLGIAEACGGLLPEQKLARVQQLQAAGGKVLMVGDGINDVPVLAGADVSVAMAGATALAQARADSLLTNGRLMTLAHAFALAGDTRAIIRQNLAWAIGYNLLALPFAAAGLVPPWLAAAGMSASSLVVVLNALRLGRRIHVQ
ncbi:heavy metal translocating P-type ATPase [Simiduia agarivorans]|uniref:Cation-transporting P-type ATPase n=1 Tax=Simiduia agarivorans (strain DSM 21679 / JCM 13881 / BCRC 17597 / SA1) TaxID=1117647 RepID=K4KID6_SIMAS|nr:heavy metal translocating P-type ATPase [Simiduia agarivorans]AFU98786.1 cation-transporting P-type ATPase [Simiduia agarivorans SA1 = DSM 21679]